MYSTGRLSPVGRLSPSQSVRGDIPIIPAAQNSLAVGAAALGGDTQYDAEVVSESDTELEPPR